MDSHAMPRLARCRATRWSPRRLDLVMSSDGSKSFASLQAWKDINQHIAIQATNGYIYVHYCYISYIAQNITTAYERTILGWFISPQFLRPHVGINLRDAYPYEKETPPRHFHFFGGKKNRLLSPALTQSWFRVILNVIKHLKSNHETFMKPPISL